MGRSRDIADEVILAEAAAWLARLQAGDRSPAAEAGFRAWLSDNPAHAEAFARATDVWEVIPGAAGPAQARRDAQSGSAPARRSLVPVLLAACLALVFAIGGGAAWLARDPVYVTAKGEQQVVTLSDGSRVSLNTDSRLTIAYSEGERRVLLDRGEAIFEVAKNPRRPFLVQAGQEQVRALGTTFVVRRTGSDLAVVLIEGRVQVSRTASAQGKASPLATLSPGERITIRADAGMAMDRPRIDAAIAWRRGEVMFDDTSLIDAVGELNRYGPRQIMVGDPGLAQLRVSGVFTTGEPDEFAEAMAQIHHLRTENRGDHILLRR